jgi:amidase
VGKFSSDSKLITQLNQTPRNDIEKSIHDQWRPSTYEKAPISLQLIGRRHNEEKLLAMLNVVENAIRSHMTGKEIGNDVDRSEGIVNGVLPVV